MPSNPEIILFHYHLSVFSKRVIWYLNFRRIPYTECIQPPILPRPTLNELGISYRRIPILSIGRDIYNDTRLIISKLDTLFPPPPPNPSISPQTPESAAIQKLLELWMIDGGIFDRGVQLIPPTAGLFKDKKFRDDRKGFMGRSAFAGGGKEEAVVEIRGVFEWFERGLLGDGRRWLLGEEGPGTVDIEGVWMLWWLKGIPNALPPNQISAKQFPKTFAWIERFEDAAKSAARENKPKSMKGPEVIEKIERSGFAEPEGDVDGNDALTGFEKGMEVEVWPIDTGTGHKDCGKLSSLNGMEVVVESQTRNGRVVRIHCPRHGFRIAKVDSKTSKL